MSTRDLTEAQISWARGRYEEGATLASLSGHLGVCPEELVGLLDARSQKQEPASQPGGAGP